MALFEAVGHDASGVVNNAPGALVDFSQFVEIGDLDGVLAESLFV